jgi:acyl-CoA thioester hydrolase
MIDSPFERYRTTVIPDWVDYNGHMNVAYYVLAFDQGVDKLFDALGVGADYLARTGHSIFALQAHVAYERELCLGESLSVRSMVLAVDRKRMHLFHEMFHAEEGWRAATMESMAIHVDMAARRSAPFPPDILAGLEAASARHATLSRPLGIGRPIMMPR